ncbi:MAG: YceI family protein [bacterium]
MHERCYSIFSRYLIFSIFFLAWASAQAQTADTVKVEPNHSTIGFVVPIAGGITKVTGKFTDFKVTLSWNEPISKNSDLTKCSINAAIKAASLNTGNADRDKDLQGAQFFDAQNHPEITFQSQLVKKKGGEYFMVGDLTMRGKTKTLELPVVVTGMSPTEDGRPVWGFSTRLKLNRKEFDIGTDWVHSAIPNFIGDEVTVEIDLWTRPPKKRQ